MMKVRVLFYRAKLDIAGVITGRHWPHALDDIIAGWTGLWNPGTGPYSHTEIWTPDEEGRFFSHGRYQGTCWTSTLRHDWSGVIKRPADGVLTHPGRWDYCELELDAWAADEMIGWMDMQCGLNRGYDIWTLTKFFLPFAKWRRSSPRRFICSEFVQGALEEAGCFRRRRLWSPRRLSGRLAKMGHRTKMLVGADKELT
jgi:hypothetical protein